MFGCQNISYFVMLSAANLLTCWEGVLSGPGSRGFWSRPDRHNRYLYLCLPWWSFVRSKVLAPRRSGITMNHSRQHLNRTSRTPWLTPNSQSRCTNATPILLSFFHYRSRGHIRRVDPRVILSIQQATSTPTNLKTESHFHPVNTFTLHHSTSFMLGATTTDTTATTNMTSLSTLPINSEDTNHLTSNTMDSSRSEEHTSELQSR